MQPLIFAIIGISLLVVALTKTANAETVMGKIISNDRTTWPSGDKVWALCQAIAIAEGYPIRGSVPNIYHNPGDLSPGDTPGFIGDEHSGSIVSMLPDDETGWSFLRAKIKRIAEGRSSAYPLSMSFNEMAQKYAGDWRNWVNNVVNDLRRQGYSVSADTRLRDFFA